MSAVDPVSLLGSGRGAEPTFLVGYRVFTIEDLLDETQCAGIRAWAEARQWEHEAPISTASGFVRRTAVRNNDRLIVDDHDWAAALWSRVEHAFPLIADCPPVGLNERFRFYRYRPGQYFKAHYDGYYARPEGSARSVFTLMLYLSDVEAGGGTRFHDARGTVTPREGMACGFVHDQLHAGEPVLQGEKWVLRTDVMYDLRPASSRLTP